MYLLEVEDAIYSQPGYPIDQRSKKQFLSLLLTTYNVERGFLDRGRKFKRTTLPEQSSLILAVSKPHNGNGRPS